MQKLILTIYLYFLSGVGTILFIIGLFSTIHWIIGIAIYEKYPLQNNSRFFAPPMHIESGGSGCIIPASTRAQKNVIPQEVFIGLDGSGSISAPRITKVAVSNLERFQDNQPQISVIGECLKGRLKEQQNGLEKERQKAKIEDFEKSIAFTFIGLLVFGSHFYFARKIQ